MRGRDPQTYAAALSRDRREMVIDTHRGLGFVVSNTGAYSHAGIYGTYFLVDPERELVILILTQSIYGGNPGQAFIEAVNNAVTEAPIQAR